MVDGRLDYELYDDDVEPLNPIGRMHRAPCFCLAMLLPVCTSLSDYPAHLRVTLWCWQDDWWVTESAVREVLSTCSAAMSAAVDGEAPTASWPALNPAVWHACSERPGLVCGLVFLSEDEGSWSGVARAAWWACARSGACSRARIGQRCTGTRRS